MKAVIRDVEIHLEKLSRFIYSNCSCPVGNVGRCHHVTAVALHISKNISATDVICSWKEKKKRGPQTVEEVKTVAELCGVVKKPKLDNEEALKLREWFRTSLISKKITSVFSWYLGDEPPEVESPSAQFHLDPLVRGDVLRQFPEDRREKFIRERFVLTEEIILDIALRTCLQFQNVEFCLLRQHRLTASNFNFILSAIERNSFPPSFWARLRNQRDLSTVPAIEHGRKNEPAARQFLQEKYPKWNIQQAGIYLHKNGILGASPDSITDYCTIEIKCPYSMRDVSVDEGIRIATKKNTKKNGELRKLQYQYIVYLNKNGKLVLNPKHEYYDQIQAQLSFTKKEFAILCLWTYVDAKVLKIRKSPTWESNVNILENFFFQKWLPYLLSLPPGTL